MASRPLLTAFHPSPRPDYDVGALGISAVLLTSLVTLSFYDVGRAAVVGNPVRKAEYQQVEPAPNLLVRVPGVPFFSAAQALDGSSEVKPDYEVEQLVNTVIRAIPPTGFIRPALVMPAVLKKGFPQPEIDGTRLTLSLSPGVPPPGKSEATASPVRRRPYDQVDIAPNLASTLLTPPVVGSEGLRPALVLPAMQKVEYHQLPVDPNLLPLYTFVEPPPEPDTEHLIRPPFVVPPPRRAEYVQVDSLANPLLIASYDMLPFSPVDLSTVDVLQDEQVDQLRNLAIRLDVEDGVVDVPRVSVGQYNGWAVEYAQVDLTPNTLVNLLAPPPAPLGKPVIPYIWPEFERVPDNPPDPIVSKIMYIAAAQASPGVAVETEIAFARGVSTPSTGTGTGGRRQRNMWPQLFS